MELTEKVKELLQGTQPRGPQFTKTVLDILQRENNWVFPPPLSSLPVSSSSFHFHLFDLLVCRFCGNVSFVKDSRRLQVVVVVLPPSNHYQVLNELLPTSLVPLLSSLPLSHSTLSPSNPLSFRWKGEEGADGERGTVAAVEPEFRQP